MLIFSLGIVFIFLLFGLAFIFCIRAIIKSFKKRDQEFLQSAIIYRTVYTESPNNFKQHSDLQNVLGLSKSDIQQILLPEFFILQMLKDKDILDKNIDNDTLVALVQYEYTKSGFKSEEIESFFKNVNQLRLRKLLKKYYPSAVKYRVSKESLLDRYYSRKNRFPLFSFSDLGMEHKIRVRI